MLLNRGSVGAQEAPRTVSIEGAQVWQVLQRQCRVTVGFMEASYKGFCTVVLVNCDCVVTSNNLTDKYNFNKKVTLNEENRGSSFTCKYRRTRLLLGTFLLEIRNTTT